MSSRLLKKWKPPSSPPPFPQASPSLSTRTGGTRPFRSESWKISKTEYSVEFERTNFWTHILDFQLRKWELGRIPSGCWWSKFTCDYTKLTSKSWKIGGENSMFWWEFKVWSKIQTFSDSNLLNALKKCAKSVLTPLLPSNNCIET